MILNKQNFYTILNILTQDSIKDVVSINIEQRFIIKKKVENSKIQNPAILQT